MTRLLEDINADIATIVANPHWGLVPETVGVFALRLKERNRVTQNGLVMPRPIEQIDADVRVVLANPL